MLCLGEQGQILRSKLLILPRKWHPKILGWGRPVEGCEVRLPVGARSEGPRRTGSCARHRCGAWAVSGCPARAEGTPGPGRGARFPPGPVPSPPSLTCGRAVPAGRGGGAAGGAGKSGRAGRGGAGRAHFLRGTGQSGGAERSQGGRHHPSPALPR